MDNTVVMATSPPIPLTPAEEDLGWTKLASLDLVKPAEGECHGILPIGGNLQVDDLTSSISSCTSDPVLRWILSFPLGLPLMKDDVFFAPPHTFNIHDADDAISLSSSDSDSHKSPSPDLSPLTSPSSFLYYEPLFGGIEDLLSRKRHEEESTSKPPRQGRCRRVSTQSIDLDWLALLHDFHEDEDEDDIPFHHKSVEQKMHNLQLSDSDEEGEEEESDYCLKAQSPQRRRKRGRAGSFTPRYRKYQKQKKDRVSSEEPVEPLTIDQEKTLFEQLTAANIDWCRYCGTTEGVNWRPGPWGKRTLCNKHGCDYKGYGLASRLPRLDLSAFSNETLQDRTRPIVQQFCTACQNPTQSHNLLVPCEGGCSRAYHLTCHPLISTSAWYCSDVCKDNRRRNKVVVDLPRKHLPLMRLQKQPLEKNLFDQDEPDSPL
ncbi:GATA-type zinc finger transcription factor [Phycomyces blakesleeanus]|uniref:GATA-type zinc finger transcription factor n=2 Tax=Phycomyces blakesleeanus TaxID=4837 RepID=A0A162NCY0_PHYB8|nr:GATA-type zinc finger transcription factor [Phycomyces blakesleeanus NRRL 1555(-)]OAD68244.1 GATA-type zinc finger transcription factor [Phycomyces blakesleeanus NRRL 1555(-)]|eukprot:XP_018286284.1 GATA-type zinc finger transcription factor [Phycomyces blakesleeanus NRRL 1555(-)]